MNIKNNVNLKKNINNLNDKNNINNFKDKFKKINLKLKKKKKYINKLKKKIFNLEKNINNIKLRSKADLENIRKRNEKNIENIYKYSLEKFAINILPIIDDLKNALKNKKNKNLNLKVIYEGINLTLKNLLLVIKKFNISVINKVNIKFDPDYHQAMIIEKSKDKNKDNIIISILQDGYIMNDRLLRPAMVKIFKYEN